ncbi:Tetratricopeptide repeat protein [Sulfidibacter corallicola]|uniref:Tetratricopeptide repeat protein n=2 Tax=Sulfidibacter corallicola TaxID=2818388 RepID=A0A8A4TGA0_SULCO|nr:tetratricopeptide repeat protein [Sulfidibacter corallicola]
MKGWMILLMPTLAWAQVSRVNLYVEDLHGNPIPGVSIFSKPGQAEAPTGDDGRTVLLITGELHPGEEVELKVEGDSVWVFLTPHFRINCPNPREKPVTVVLVKKGDRDILASAAAKREIVRNLLTLIGAHFDVTSQVGDAERQRLALASVAENLGLPPEEIDQAIRVWRNQTGDLFDEGLAALYERRFPEAIPPLVQSYNRSKERLKKKEKALEDERETLAERAFFLGQALNGVGKYREALAKYQEAVNLQPHRHTYSNGLGVALVNMGLYKKARALFSKLLDERISTSGDEHPQTLASMNNLAQSLYAQGDWAGARVLHEKVLEISRRTLGDEHPQTLRCMNNLGGTLKAQGDLPGARVLLERVLEISRRTLGDEHPQTLRCMNNLAQSLKAQGDWAGARVLLEKVLEISRRTLGDKHPHTLTSMNNLAQSLYAQGDLSGARVLLEKVLEIRRRTLGDAHPDTLICMNNLAGTLKAQGDLPGARILEEKVLEIRQRTLGERHPDTMISHWSLLLTYRTAGRTDEFMKKIPTLMWLLDAEDKELSADLRTIRNHLKQLLEEIQNEGEREPEEAQ